MAYTLSNFGGTATLDKVAKTITVSGYTIPDAAINKISAILDFTAGVIITQANSPSKGITSITSNVITIEYDTNTAVFANTDVIEIYLNDMIGMDPTTDTNKSTVVNPTNSQYVTPIELENTTNKAAATYYYPDSTGWLYQGMKDHVFQLSLIDATATLETTDETIATPVKWTDSTEMLQVEAGDATYRTGLGGYTSFNNCTIRVSMRDLAGYKLRWKIVTVDGTNTVYLSVTSKGF